MGKRVLFSLPLHQVELLREVWVPKEVYTDETVNRVEIFLCLIFLSRKLATYACSHLL